MRKTSPCFSLPQICRALLAVAGSSLALTPAEAHPFSFDTATMPGFEVLTAEDGAMKALNLVVIEYKGEIDREMAANLETIWKEVGTSRRFNRVALRLDSPGGSNLHGARVIELLRNVREHAELTTIVGEGELCASMCVAVYIQGEIRYASPASAWMFHGACRGMTNIPSLSLTQEHFGIYREREIDPTFIDYLFEEEYVTAPGAYWVSGTELAERSNIITRLMPNWKPAEPRPGPVNVIRGGI
jgi:hypothetical protein